MTIFNDELERTWKEASWRNLMYYPRLFLEKLRNIMNNVPENRTASIIRVMISRKLQWEPKISRNN
jgi:hypothetical protein